MGNPRVHMEQHGIASISKAWFSGLQSVDRGLKLRWRGGTRLSSAGAVGNGL